MQEESEIRRNRDKFVTEVRRQNRDQLFLATRKKAAERHQQPPSIIIVDPRFHDLIQQYSFPHPAQPPQTTTPARWAATSAHWRRRTRPAGTRR